MNYFSACVLSLLFVLAMRRMKIPLTLLVAAPYDTNILVSFFAAVMLNVLGRLLQL